MYISEHFCVNSCAYHRSEYYMQITADDLFLGLIF
jgi:hypothetical protein